jgi:methionyl aminopeptidase
MTDGPHPSQVKAGRVAARIMEEISKEIASRRKVITICSMVEKKIIEYGARPAFPCNVSVNNIAAHYTSPINDSSVIPEFGLVKVDIGVHVDGYIADMAKTFDIDGTLEGFVAATDDALDEAVSLLTPGTKLGDIGRKIESVISAYGLKPIRNLTGHSIERWKLHAGKRVPNVKARVPDVVEEGEVYAIEPFATNGAGLVIDSDLLYIFSNTGQNEPLEGTTEQLRAHLYKKYGPLPFASRWIGTKSKDINLFEILKALMKRNAIRAYPVQVTKKGRLVSQSEHTIYVSKDGPLILTRND